MERELDKLEVLVESCVKYNVSFSGTETSAIMETIDKWCEIVESEKREKEKEKREKTLSILLRVQYLVDNIVASDGYCEDDLELQEDVKESIEYVKNDI